MDAFIQFNIIYIGEDLHWQPLKHAGFFWRYLSHSGRLIIPSIVSLFQIHRLEHKSKFSMIVLLFLLTMICSTRATVPLSCRILQFLHFLSFCLYAVPVVVSH
jgi:hypothetical protein